MIEIETYMEKKSEIINKQLGKHLPKTGSSVLDDAINYSLAAGGKRLRPILVIAVAETIAAEDDSVIDLACALEYLHTYSLIHDDLPAMDDSDLRRGKPACHCAYGEAVAILAGDALLTASFETIAKYGLSKNREKKAVQIISELASAAGTAGMIGGQILDLEAEGANLSLVEIEQIAAKKTGALIKAAILCGAIAADANTRQKEALSLYADRIGPAFQIIDDLLDYGSTTEILGKPAGADATRSKATLPALLGLEEAKKQAETLYFQAIAALDDLNRPTWLLAGIAKLMIFRNY